MPMDRDFEPLFNFLAQAPKGIDQAPSQVVSSVVAAPVRPTAARAQAVAPVKAAVATVAVKSPAAVAATGLLRQIKSARDSVTWARKRVARAAVAQLPASKSERVRVWIDLDDLASNVVRADGRPADAADSADWLLRLNFLFDGEAWLGDRDDLKLLGGVGVVKVRRGE